MKSFKLSILIPLLIGGLQNANAEVVVPAGTTLNEDLTAEEVTNNGDGTYTFNQDFNCSSSNAYVDDHNNVRTMVWGCIDALSDSVGSSSSSISTNTSDISTNTSDISTNTS